MSSLFLHVIQLILAFWSKPENSNVFVDPMLEKTTEKYWLGRDGEKHAKLCLDASQSS